MGALGARLPFTAPVCFQFVGRLEHTCGPTAPLRCDCSNIVTVQIQEYVVSGQVVKDCLRPDNLLIQVESQPLTTYSCICAVTVLAQSQHMGPLISPKRMLYNRQISDKVFIRY